MQKPRTAHLVASLVAAAASVSAHATYPTSRHGARPHAPPCVSHARAALVVCQADGAEPDDVISPPIDLRCLARQEVVDKLNGVPAFAIASSDGRLLSIPQGEEGRAVCRFFLELADAQAAVDELQEANPNVAIGLTVAPLGTAFALSEWQEQVDEERCADDLASNDAELDRILMLDDNDDGGDNDDALSSERDGGLDAALDGVAASSAAAADEPAVRLVAAAAEVAAARDVLDESPVPPLLRRRNRREGAIPLFGSDALRFQLPADGDEDGPPVPRTPLFFRRADVVAAWGASGGAPDALPPVQVTDLRTIAHQMQHDATQDWRPLLFVAPEDAIDFVKQQQLAQERAAQTSVDLTPADVQGLLFGDAPPAP